jgi:hypothetical protein
MSQTESLRLVHSHDHFLMAAVLIVNGAGYMIAGVTWTVYIPIGLDVVRRGKRAWESDAA